MDTPLIPLIAFVASVVFLGWQARNIVLGLASRRWKPVDCVIVRAWVDEHTNSDPDGADSVSYSAKVEYTYKIGSTTYRSTRLSYQPTSSLGFKRATALLQGLHAGRTSTAYYNPRNKGQAVLIRSAAVGNAVPILVAVALCALTASWLVAKGG